jgi:hypothetical protein
MAKKKTPAELREEAKRLMDQAQQEEHSRLKKIGELFVNYMEKKFVGFDLAVFKEDAAKIWKG